MSIAELIRSRLGFLASIFALRSSLTYTVAQHYMHLVLKKTRSDVVAQWSL